MQLLMSRVLRGARVWEVMLEQQVKVLNTIHQRPALSPPPATAMTDGPVSAMSV